MRSLNTGRIIMMMSRFLNSMWALFVWHPSHDRLKPLQLNDASSCQDPVGLPVVMLTNRGGRARGHWQELGTPWHKHIMGTRSL